MSRVGSLFAFLREHHFDQRSTNDVVQQTRTNGPNTTLFVRFFWFFPIVRLPRNKFQRGDAAFTSILKGSVSPPFVIVAILAATPSGEQKYKRSLVRHGHAAASA
jgi:hypothetical protein